jgi:hypothetical protein
LLDYKFDHLNSSTIDWLRGRGKVTYQKDQLELIKIK